MNRFSRSWTLFKSTWAVLRADKELTWYPVLAAASVVIVSVIYFGLLIAAAVAGLAMPEAIAAAGQENTSFVQLIVMFLVLFPYFLLTYFVANYFMTGLAGAALMRFEGQDPTFGDGMRIARSRAGAIFGFSVIAATVGVILSALRGRSNNGNAGGRIAASIGGAAWNIVTFLVIPVIAAQGLGPIDAIKESASLLRRTWGEQIIGTAGIGFVFGLVMIAVLVIAGGLIVLAVDYAAALIVIGVLAIIAIAVLAVINSALGGIYKAAVYQYAVSGEVTEQFDQDLIAHTFKPKLAGAS